MKYDSTGIFTGNLFTYQQFDNIDLCETVEQVETM